MYKLTLLKCYTTNNLHLCLISFCHLAKKKIRFIFQITSHLIVCSVLLTVMVLADNPYNTYHYANHPYVKYMGYHPHYVPTPTPKPAHHHIPAASYPAKPAAEPPMDDHMMPMDNEMPMDDMMDKDKMMMMKEKDDMMMSMDKDTMMDMKEMEDEKSAEMKMEPSMPHHHAAYAMPHHAAPSYHVTPAPYHHMPHHPHHQPYTPHVRNLVSSISRR